MTPSTANTGKALDAALPARLEAARRDLAACRAQADRTTTISVVVALIILVALAIYFSYGYYMISQVLEPEYLVAAAETMVSDRLPGLRADAEKKIVDSSPEWARSLNKQLLQSIPDARKQLENLVAEQVATKTDEAHVLTTQHFKDFLKENRGLIDAKLKELANSERLSKESLKEIHDALEKSFQSDMQAQSKVLLEGMQSLTKRIKKLAANQGLTREEDTERRLYRLVRRMQLEKVNPDLFKDEPPAEQASAAPRGTPVIPAMEGRRNKKGTK